MSTISVARFVVLLVIAAFALPTLAVDPAPESEPASTEAAEPAEGDFTPPQIVLGSQKQPVFPPAAFGARYTGSVMVEMTVHTDGTVGEAKVVECTRPKVGFEEAAMDAVKKWRFQPALENGEPIEVTTRIKLNFTRIGSGDRAKPQVSAGSFTTASRDISTGQRAVNRNFGGSSGPDPK